MDIATYGVGIFTPVILQSLDPAAGVDSTLIYREIHVGHASGLVDLFLLLGFLMGIWLVPRVGAVRMQILGFAGMAVGMLVLAWASGLAAADADRSRIVILGFVLFNLAMNMGPNSTTFTLPALLFPTTLRSTASGFAAACAKAGATLGTFFLPDLRAGFGHHRHAAGAGRGVGPGRAGHGAVPASRRGRRRQTWALTATDRTAAAPAA